MEQATFISELEAAISLGANRAAFTKFLEQQDIRTFLIAGGRVMLRKDFYAAVSREIAKAGR
jgi:hypothetical protein